MKNTHSRDIDTIVSELNSHVSDGLKSKQIDELKSQFGENALVSKAKKSILSMVIGQFKDFMIIILIIAAIISIMLGDEIEGFVILGIVILNATLGTYQENKASNALDALKSLAAPMAKVIRNGELASISSKELVPGDIVVLEAGDYVPADLRLFESVNLRIDESALTGESVAVEKYADEKVEEKAPLADRINCAYMSTIVTYGRGKGFVTETGLNTQIGQIATMLNESEETQTPLQKKLEEFGKFLGIVCILVSVVIFILGWMRGDDLFEIFMTAVSLAVAAIPEGLPAVVTVVLAMGMQRMIKRHAIMKRLSAVETLGSTSTICTDKTGTLTQNKMTVHRVFNGAGEWQVTGTGYGFEGDIELTDSSKAIKNDTTSDGSQKDLNRLLSIGVLCNDADIKDGDVIGDPTEGALIVMAAKNGLTKTSLNERHPRLKEFPFDSDRKLMSTLHKFDEDYLMLTKGAPDVILRRSSKIMVDGRIIDLSDQAKATFLQQNNDYAEQAMRVLAYAFKVVNKDAVLENEEEELVFMGLTGMIDPPREEAKTAVALCKKAGIRVVMITGDHITTASAIAKEIGILDEQSKAMEGIGIDDLSHDEFLEVVKHTNVFARVSPEHKVKIVSAIRENGDVAAMTGDGVNDAPALKKADIGIAMGITGTDVSKEAADMILTDDNFASIVDAVEEGRIIYSNIRKFVSFLLSCNIGEILIIFLAILFKWPVPLLPIQLLWVNLITDSFPAFALGLEEGDDGIMNVPPRDRDEPIVDKRMRIALIVQSIGLTVAVLTSFRIGYSVFGVGHADQENLARTFCFTTLIVGEMIRSYSARSETKSMFNRQIFSNRFLNLSVLGALVLLFVVIYAPFLSSIFSTIALGPLELLVAVGLGFIPTIASEIGKTIKA